MVIDKANEVVAVATNPERPGVSVSITRKAALETLWLASDRPDELARIRASAAEVGISLEHPIRGATCYNIMAGVLLLMAANKPDQSS